MKKLHTLEQQPFDSNAGGYEPSRDLLYCNMFAGMLSYDQGSSEIDIAHMICGLYLGYDETAGYWDDLRRMRNFLSTECMMDWPKWFYYSELYEHLCRRQKSTFVGKRMKRSKALGEIFEGARGYCEGRNLTGQSGKPIMIPEDLLFAMAQRAELRICVELVKSGLATDRLRTVVTQQ